MNILLLISHTKEYILLSFWIIESLACHLNGKSPLSCVHVCAGEQLSSFSPAAVHPAVVAGVGPEPL